MALTEERRRELESLLGIPAQAKQQVQNSNAADQLEEALGLKKPQIEVEGLSLKTTTPPSAISPFGGSGIPTGQFGTVGEAPTVPEEETFGGKVIGGIKTGTKKVAGGVSGIAKSGSEKFIEGLKDIGKLVTGQPVDFISPTAAEDIAKLGGNIGNILEGGMQATFAAPGAVAEMIPGVKQGLEGLGKGIEYTAEEFTKNIGQDPNSEEGKRTKQAVSNFLNLVTLYIGEKAGKFAKGTSPLTKDIQAVVQKGIDYVKKGAEAVDTGIEGITKPLPVEPSIVAPVVPPTPKALEPNKAAVRIVESTMKIDPNDAVNFQKMTGENYGKWMVDRNIIKGREPAIVDLTERWQKAKDILDDGVAQIPGNFTHPAVGEMLSELVDFYKETRNPEKAATTTKMLNKLNEEGLTMTEIINEVKRPYERNVKLDYLKSNLNRKVIAANNLDSAVREFVIKTAEDSGFTNFRELSKEIQGAHYLADKLWKKFAKQRPNNLFSLTDNLLLVGGAINPSSLAVLGLKKILSSEAFKGFQARMLRTGATKKIPQVPLGITSPRKLLPSPKEGQPKVQIETPMEMPKESPSTIEARESMRLQSQTMKPKPAATAKPIPTSKNNIKSKPSTKPPFPKGKGAIPETKEGALIISADVIKEKQPGYKPENAPLFHKESSRLAEKEFADALKDPQYNEVVLMAGGPGSGKTEVGLKPLVGNSNMIIFDGTLANLEKAQRHIQQALDAGKRVKIQAVIASLEDAYSFMLSRPRKVPLDTFFSKHSNSKNTLYELAKDPNLEINIKNNPKGLPPIAKTFTSTAQKLEYLKSLNDLTGKPSSVQSFKKSLDNMPAADKAYLTEFTTVELSKMKTYLDRNGKAGYAIKEGGELVNLFNYGEKGRGRVMLVEAIKNGARKLDCVGDKLKKYYEKFGFKVEKTVKWNDKYAPKNWNYAENGRPNIYFMSLRP